MLVLDYFKNMIKKISPIDAINLQPSIATGQDCNGTDGFILAQESNSHKKENRNPKFHDWSYVESGNSQCQSITKKTKNNRNGCHGCRIELQIHLYVQMLVPL